MLNPISAAFKIAKKEKRPALLTYTVAGDGSKKQSLNPKASRPYLLESKTWTSCSHMHKAGPSEIWLDRGRTEDC